MRHLIHILASIAMWCVFGYYWFLVLARRIGPGTRQAVSILGLLVAIGLALTIYWVWHNQRLARRFGGRRRAVHEPGVSGLDKDTLGRAIQHPGLAGLERAAIVDITADEEVKTYVVAATEVRG